MTTKLVSANMGIILVVEQDGEEKTVKWSMTFPNHDTEQPMDAVYALKLFLDDVFGYSIEHKEVPIAKPKRIKAPRRVSQNEFNRRIKELGYKP